MVKWPFQRLSDLQVDEKVTLNHLVYFCSMKSPMYIFLETKFSMNSNIQIAVEMFCGGLILM